MCPSDFPIPRDLFIKEEPLDHESETNERRRSLRPRFEKKAAIKYVGEYIKDCENNDVYVLTAVGSTERHSPFEDHVRSFLLKRGENIAEKCHDSKPNKSRVRRVKQELIDSPSSTANIPSSELTLIQSEFEHKEEREDYFDRTSSDASEFGVNKYFLEKIQSSSSQVEKYTPNLEHQQELEKLSRIPLILNRFVEASSGVQLLAWTKMSGIMRINPCEYSNAFRHDNIDVTFHVQTKNTCILLSRAGSFEMYNYGDFFTLKRGITFCCYKKILFISLLKQF
jgi:hypothetical protein